MYRLKEENICIYGDKDTGKTSLLNSYFDELNEEVDTAVLDSTVQHGEKSLINKILREESFPLYNSPREEEVLDKGEIYDYINGEDEALEEFYPRIDSDDMIELGAILFDMSKYPEESHQVNPENYEAKRETFRNLSNQVILTLFENYGGENLTIFMDEITINEQTEMILREYKDRPVNLVSAFHQRPNVEIFDQEVNLNRKRHEEFVDLQLEK